MKTIIVSVFILLLFGYSEKIVFAQTCAPAPVGLVSAWSGDGNALEARSRSNGTIQNGVNYTAGEVGQAFNLAGNSGDRILVGNPANLQLQNFTIEAWIKRSSSTVVTNSPNGTGVGIFFAYGQNGFAFYIDQLTNKLVLGQTGVSQTIAPTLTITDTNWHHVAITQKGIPFSSISERIFYLDGVADTTITSQFPEYSFTTNAAIGSRGDGVTDNVFFGAIDELAIYNRSLASLEIMAIFNAATSGKCKPIATSAPDNQVLWLAGDGEANDISANGNNGTLQNGANFKVGNVGQGFNLDGVDDYILIPPSASLDVGTSGGFTAESWINPSVGQKDALVEWSGGGSYGVHFFVGLSCPGFPCSNPPITTGALYGNLIDTSNVNHQFGTASGVVSNNAWTHVALTYDKTSGIGVIYVNGTAVETRNLGTFTPKTNLPLNLGARPIPDIFGCTSLADCAFSGKIDETSIYNRALSAAEIQSISNAGLAGKYKIQSTIPADIAAWHPGDGNTNDLQAANNATLQGGATYGVGKVGQAFSFNGTTAYVSAPSTTANDPTGAANGASMEAWVYFNQRPSDAGHQMYIMSKTSPAALDGFEIRVDADNFIKFVWRGGVIGFTTVSVQTGVWYQIVGTFSPSTTGPTAGTVLYVNGVRLGGGNNFSPRTPSGAPLDIGHSSALGGNRYFNGLIDEPTIYNRTLTQDEITGLFNAGNGGKYKGASNPAVSNKIQTGDAEVTFGGITNAGAVQLTPLDGTLFPALPMGTNTGLNFDISTSASYSNPTVCFNVSSFTLPQFVNLRILHLESGVWQNRTAPANTYPNLCTNGLTSLSPFAISQVAPTAANTSISGRVRNSIGSGIRNVSVSVLTSGGEVYRTTTSTFGYYRLDDLPVGETYILNVSAGKYNFINPTRVVTLMDEVSNEDFIAYEYGSSKTDFEPMN